MGLRCSLLGHDFAESEVENEREQQGSEVVVTVRELDRCARCGTTRVVSENTEVRSVDEQAADDAPERPATRTGEDVETAASGGSTAGVDVDATATDPDDDDAVILDAEDEGPVDAADAAHEHDDATETADVITDAEETADDEASGDGVDAETAADEDVEFIDAGADDGTTAGDRTPDVTDDHDAEPDGPNDEETVPEDDGVILDEDGDGDDRGHGEWPAVDRDEEAGEDPQDWPAVDADADEGFDAETAADPAASVEADPDVGETDADEDVEFIDADRSPSAPDESETQWVEADPAGDREADLAGTGSGITSAESVADDVARGETPTELVCPECGHTAQRNPSSLRPGDICPECSRGYISEQAVER